VKLKTSHFLLHKVAKTKKNTTFHTPEIFSVLLISSSIISKYFSFVNCQGYQHNSKNIYLDKNILYLWLNENQNNILLFYAHYLSIYVTDHEKVSVVDTTKRSIK